MAIKTIVATDAAATAATTATATAATTATAAAADFAQVYREARDAWLAGPLVQLAKNLRATAHDADTKSKNVGGRAAALESCGGSLQRIFSAAVAGSEHCLLTILFHLDSLLLLYSPSLISTPLEKLA